MPRTNVFLMFTIYNNLSLDCLTLMISSVSSCFTYLPIRYIENVFPGDYGVPRPFYFPFQPSYWCGKRVVPVGGGNMEMSQMDENFEEEPSSLDVGIHIKNMRKVFKVH